jgi:hypothetical protein
MGDSRFTAGIALQMLLKKGYTCSLATYGHLVDPDITQPEARQRADTKNAISTHYVDEYSAEFSGRWQEERPVAGGVIQDLVGAKRPSDQWEHDSYDHLYSFYAGKV